MNKKQILLFFIAISMSCWSVFASYQVEFTPSLSLDTQYDDNIYLYNANEESDWITSLSPGIIFNITSQKNSLSLNYSPSIVRYKERDDNDTTRHLASLSFNQSLSQRLEFNISDTYIKSEDPIEGTEGIISVRTTRSTYYRNSAEANIRYNFGSANLFELGYRHSLLENDDPTIDDGTIEDPYASYLYWFNTKHGLELNAGYTKADFSRDGALFPDDDSLPEDDYTGLTQGIGYRYRYNPNSTVFMHYDFTNRDFKGDTTDYEVYEGTLGLEKNISQDVSYNVSAGYFLRKNDLDESDGGLNADISITKTFNRGSFNISGRSGWDEAYLEAENRGFTKYQSITSSFNYRATENLSNNISVSYRQDKDETEISRKSKTVSAGYGWSWSFLRYYSMSLDYTCFVRDDYIDTDDYLVNRVMFRLRWSRPYR
jgi:hypothetical protein